MISMHAKNHAKLQYFFYIRKFFSLFFQFSSFSARFLPVPIISFLSPFCVLSFSARFLPVSIISFLSPFCVLSFSACYLPVSIISFLSPFCVLSFSACYLPVSIISSFSIAPFYSLLYSSFSFPLIFLFFLPFCFVYSWTTDKSRWLVGY